MTAGPATWSQAKARADLLRQEESLMRDEIIKRAFDLAGQCGSVDELRHKLQQEGYFHVQAHLSGPQIVADLRRRLNPELKATKNSR